MTDHAAALAEVLRECADIVQGEAGPRHPAFIRARTALAAYDAASQSAPKTGVSDAQQTDSGRDQECT